MSELLDLLRIFARLWVLAFQMNQDGPFTAFMTLEEQSRLLSGVTWFCFDLLAFCRARQTNRTARYHGGDSVLVDHLADSVLQQNNKLVEGFDLALQLNAVNQI